MVNATACYQIVPSTSTLSGVDIDEVSKKLYLVRDHRRASQPQALPDGVVSTAAAALQAGKNMPLLRCNTDGSNLEVVADLSKMDACVEVAAARTAASQFSYLSRASMWPRRYKVRVDSASGLLYMVLGRATIAVMTTDGEVRAARVHGWHAAGQTVVAPARCSTLWMSSS